MGKKIKYILTFLHHPLVSFVLFVRGCRRFIIGKNMQINSLKYIDMGNDCYIGKDSRLMFVNEYHGGKYKPGLKIGEKVTIGNRCSFLSASPIVIGNKCLIASDVLFTSENHGMDPEASENYADIPLESKPICIEDGVWIGEKVSILPGVVIGKRSIVAANSVVNKSIPPYCIAAGSPAKVVKKYDFTEHCWRRV